MNLIKNYYKLALLCLPSSIF